MKYGIVGRFAPDMAKINLPSDVVKSLRVGDGAANDVNVASFLAGVSREGLTPSRAVRDLLMFAICVYVADTRIDRSNGQDGWTREIFLSIPVGELDRWNKAASTLQKALNFLTGDRWVLAFRKSKHYLNVVNGGDVNPGTPLVSLFSGGLDSFIGALDLLSTGKRLCLVGHYGFDSSASISQEKALKHVRDRKKEKQRVALVNARIAPEADIFGWGNDTNERSRSLLFIAMGLVVADGGRAARLQIPENGFISLNVPLNTLRVGTYSTRTTHPHFIALLQDALQELGVQVLLENPYRFSTKGEIIQSCRLQTDLLAICADTMSCAHPSYARFDKQPMTHCGRCTACLIRRGAFQRAFAADETDYIISCLSEAPLHSNRASEGKDIRAVRLAAERVRNRPEQAQFLVLKPGPLPPGDHHKYAELYTRGMDELWEVVKDVRTVGKF